MSIEVAESETQEPEVYSFEELERLLMSDDETETTEDSSPPESTAQAAPETPAPAPAQAQAPASEDTNPRNGSLVALQAERQEKAKLRNSYNQLLQEFEDFKRQSQQHPAPVYNQPPATPQVPDKEEDLLGWVEYEFQRRDAEIEAVRQEATRVTQDATSLANQAKFEVIQAETRRQIGEQEFDSAINAFNAYDAENPGRINMYEIFSTANPAFTAYELGRTILDAQKAAAPQAPAMDLEAMKAQLREELMQELRPSLKQEALKEAAQEIAAKLRGAPAPQRQQSIVSLPSTPGGVEKGFTAFDIPKEALANVSRDEVRKHLEQLWDYEQANPE